MAYSDLTTMRNDFLAQTQAKLLAKDFATATDSDLILSGVLIQKFDAVNNFDPISSSAISLLTGVSNFNTFLGDLSNRQAFEDAIASPSAMAAIIANSTVFANILASSTAMAAVASSSTVMNTIIASASGFANILASSTAMSAVAVSKTALSIIWGSESLLSEVRANQSAVDKLVSSPRTIYLNNNPSNLTTVQVSGKCILIKCKSDYFGLPEERVRHRNIAMVQTLAITNTHRQIVSPINLFLLLTLNISKSRQIIIYGMVTSSIVIN